MLVNLKIMLALANDKGNAVGAFNIDTLESLRAVMAGAEKLRIPVILQFAQPHQAIIPLDLIGPIMLNMARWASVPVCVHLDHGEDLEVLQRALEIGFTSVMYDGSTLPLEENIANTQAAVYLARKFDASVEGEVGTMGAGEAGGEKWGDARTMYTNPAQAEAFAAATGVDALACSFGTAHGLYRETPTLNLNVLEQIHRRVSVPLVMHGSSGLQPWQFRAAIARGIRKVNYYTYMAKAGGDGATTFVQGTHGTRLYHQIAAAGQVAMEKNVLEAMAIFSKEEKAEQD